MVTLTMTPKDSSYSYHQNKAILLITFNAKILTFKVRFQVLCTYFCTEEVLNKHLLNKYLSNSKVPESLQQRI